jgi:hypothetical protein
VVLVCSLMEGSSIITWWASGDSLVRCGLHRGRAGSRRNGPHQAL